MILLDAMYKAKEGITSFGFIMILNGIIVDIERDREREREEDGGTKPRTGFFIYIDHKAAAFSLKESCLGLWFKQHSYLLLLLVKTVE
ncbi:hypothetical protein MRB53_009577 [Persea americana]|uniref:Uncharacterized protein n=1 Tax=Persea americana TaxID=3435 RepID=A0ACC2LPE4_PERAE|nr:hypothetical protein MRB53_009577 [Persea americana]